MSSKNNKTQSQLSSTSTLGIFDYWCTAATVWAKDWIWNSFYIIYILSMSNSIEQNTQLYNNNIVGLNETEYKSYSVKATIFLMKIFFTYCIV